VSVRLAQPWALGRKVSDEFTPICRVHHREVHRTQRTAMVGAFGRRAAGYCAKLWGADPPTADAEGRGSSWRLVSRGPRGGGHGGRGTQRPSRNEPNPLIDADDIATTFA
jgi:hypothetical protein